MSRATAFLFGGQGEGERRIAGAELVRAPSVRRLLAHGSAHAGVDLVEIVRRGAPELARTELLQPALIAIGLGLAAEREAQGELPAAVAGHSLGELAAFAAAGCFSPEVAVELACLRGLHMAEAAKRTPGGGMVALTDATELQLKDALEHGRTAGVLDVAAHNAPGTWVLSGERPALRAVEARYAVTRLAVDGPWHCRCMAGAQHAWLADLRALPMTRPRRTLLANRNGRPVGPDDDLPALLAGQLTAPVQWATTLRSLQELGIQRFVTLGPSRALRGLCRANLGAEAQVVMMSAPGGARAQERAP